MDRSHRPIVCYGGKLSFVLLWIRAVQLFNRNRRKKIFTLLEKFSPVLYNLRRTRKIRSNYSESVEVSQSWKLFQEINAKVSVSMNSKWSRCGFGFGLKGSTLNSNERCKWFESLCSFFRFAKYPPGDLLGLRLVIGCRKFVIDSCARNPDADAKSLLAHSVFRFLHS